MVNTYSIITEKNCESLCLKELKNRFKISGVQGDGFVDFSANSELALRVAYFSQCAKRVLFKISSGSFKELDDLLLKISYDLKNDSWFNFLVNTYRVSCSRIGVHDFNSVIVEQEISGLIKNEVSSKNISCVPDYNSKELVFFVFIQDNNYLFGIDFAGKDLSKRHYLFFNNPNAVKGTVAFNLLLFSDFKPGMILLDCFSLAGVVPIEAAIYENDSSIHFFSKDFVFPEKIKNENFELLKKFDAEMVAEKARSNIFSSDPSFPNISAQKKNSRIAGVEKHIAFSRNNTGDLDIKNFSKEIDVVCSRIIEPSKHVPEALALKAYESLFIGAKEFLSKKGSINVIVRVPNLLEGVAKKHGFKVSEKLETAQGQQSLFFVKFKK